MHRSKKRFGNYNLCYFNVLIVIYLVFLNKESLSVSQKFLPLNLRNIENTGMQIITLTSDWGTTDHYLASVKGVLYSAAPGATIVDITHEIPCFDISRAAFILKNAYGSFPDNTVHIIGINTTASEKTPHIVARFRNQYFIGADTGIFSLIFDDKPEWILELDIWQDSDYFTFSTRDVFAKAAAHIANGEDIQKLGPRIETLNQLSRYQPTIQGNIIRGVVVYIDRYENVFTNISESFFRQYIKSGQKFEISVRNNTIRKLSKSYMDVPPGEILALFSTNGYLQIAQNHSNAASLLGMNIDDTITISFE